MVEWVEGLNVSRTGNYKSEVILSPAEVAQRNYKTDALQRKGIGRLFKPSTRQCPLFFGCCFSFTPFFSSHVRYLLLLNRLFCTNGLISAYCHVLYLLFKVLMHAALILCVLASYAFLPPLHTHIVSYRP